MTAATTVSQDHYSTANMVRRLLIDGALTHWPRYELSFSLTAIAAAATAFTAYLLGTVINKTYSVCEEVYGRGRDWGYSYAHQNRLVLHLHLDAP
jgi:hypothetical protein